MHIVQEKDRKKCTMEHWRKWMGEMEMDRNEEKYKTEKHGFCFILCCSSYHSLKAVTMSFNLNSNQLKTLTVPKFEGKVVGDRECPNKYQTC